MCMSVFVCKCTLLFVMVGAWFGVEVHVLHGMFVHTCASFLCCVCAFVCTCFLPVCGVCHVSVGVCECVRAWLIVSMLVPVGEIIQ